MEFRAYHFAALAADTPTHARRIGVHTGVFAVPSRAAFSAAVAAAAVASQRLQQRPIDSILAALDEVIRRWLADGSPWTTAARQILPDVTGFSAPVVAQGLVAMLRPLGNGAIGALLDEELGSRHVLDETGSERRLRRPRHITHVLAGNIPGLGFAPMLLSLALRSAVLVKSAAGDPYSAAAFADSIAAVDPELGACLVVHDWRGGDLTFEEVAFAVDVVVASGSDAALAAIAPRVSGRFFGHGHKVSFALLDRAALGSVADAQALAQRLAFDMALWDQQGCLSPQVCFVESGATVTAAKFAEFLAEALERLARTLPPRELDIDERAAVAAFRDEAEWRLGTAVERLLVAPAGGAWSIAVEIEPRFRPSCLNRCLRLVSIDDVAQMRAILAAHRAHLECAGLACAPQRHGEINASLAAAGVHRVCAIGEMQTPSLAWKQGGRPRVAEWVERVGEDGYGGSDGS